MLIEINYAKVQDTKCPLSQNPVVSLIEPVQATPCGHIFERTLVEALLPNDRICPLDHRQITKLTPISFFVEIEKNEIGDAECSFSLEKLKDLESLAQVSPCNHIFGNEDIKLWMTKSIACPLDRQEITFLLNVKLVEKKEEIIQPEEIRFEESVGLSEEQKKEEAISMLEEYISSHKLDQRHGLETKTLQDKADHIYINIKEEIKPGLIRKAIKFDGDPIVRLWKEMFMNKEFWDKDVPLDFEWGTGAKIWHMTLQLTVDVSPDGGCYQNVEHRWIRPTPPRFPFI